MLLHLSLFLFFGGLAIFLFNVDREVFGYVVCWIGLFLMVYGMITLLPLIRQDSPYNSPLSGPAWFLHATVTYVTLKIPLFIMDCVCPYCFFGSYSPRIDRTADWVYNSIVDSGKYYHRRILGGVEKAAEETASKRSSEIDVQILDWTISALGDDDSLKSFFETIPGFFNSKLVDHQRRFPAELLEKFSDALGGFLRRTWSSNSIDDSEKARRLDISLSAMDRIRDPFILPNIFYRLRNEMPQTVQMGRTLARWFTNRDQDIPAVVQKIIAEILLSVRKLNDNWVALAAQLYDLPERDIALGGDSLSLATLIHITRQYVRSEYFDWGVLRALSKLDIGNTLPRLQHDFCTLWNQLVQEATNKGRRSRAVSVLGMIRHLYIPPHQGTDAAPTAFSASTDWHPILYYPSSYPVCNLASHRPDSTTHLSLPLPTPPGNSPDVLSPSTDGGNTASQKAKQVNNVAEPHPTTTSEIGTSSHGLGMTPPTNPVHFNPSPTCASCTAIVSAAPQDISSTATMSHHLEGSEQQDSDIVATGAGPGTTASTHASTPTIPPVPTSLPNTPSESYDAGAACVSNSPHFSPPSIGSPIPASRPSGSATLPCLRPRGLVNTRNICFANAVMQLLVNFPSFRNLFGGLGDLEGQRGVGYPETGGGATPLVDATVRFLKELVEEESQQRSWPATGGKSRVDEERKDDTVVDSFEPTYMYDAMKEKRQLKPLLVRSRAYVAAS
jgi:hypothetical protein